MKTPPDWTNLRIFLAAIELGSIAKAAEHCGIANSAAAKRIQMLEAGAGTPLVERHARGVAATAAGEVLARHARGLVDLAGRLEDDMQTFLAGGVGTVRLLATASSIGGHDLAELLAAFAADYPRIRVDLRESTSALILQDLIEGRADLGIVTTNAHLPPGLEATFWRQDRLLAIVPDGHPLAGRATVRYAEMLDYPMIAVLEIGALALMLDEAAQRLGRAPDYRYHVSSMDAARRLVAAGHAINVMPDVMIEPYAPALGLRGIPINEAWATRRLRLIARPRESLPAPAVLLRNRLLG